MHRCLTRVPALLAALALTCPPVALAEESEESSAIRTEAPDTDSCPHSLVPAEPVTTSERLAPGQETPTPLPAVEGAPCGVSVPRGFNVNKDVVASAVTDAIRLGAIGFDAVKLIALARLERRPPRLDLAAYPHLPRTAVRTTVAADYAVLVPEVAA